MNRGKAFEAKVKEDWKKSFPGQFLLRLQDATMGYSNINTPCDEIAFISSENFNGLLMLELKSHEGNVLPFSAIPQYDRMLAYKDMPDVYPVVIIWFIDHDVVYAVPIKTLEKMKKDGKKSVNVKDIDNKDYNIYNVPSVKKRVFLDSDYRGLPEFLIENK